MNMNTRIGRLLISFGLLNTCPGILILDMYLRARYRTIPMIANSSVASAMSLGFDLEVSRRGKSLSRI